MQRRSSVRTRRNAVVFAAVCATAALALSACSHSSGGSGGLSAGSLPSTAASAPPASGAPSTAPSSAPATPTAPASSAPASHPYPSDYAGAILSAWKTHDTAYLTQLTNATTAAKLFGYGNINQTWTRLPGSGAAGHTYWEAYNQAGDWIVLRTQNVTGHQWHIGDVYTWDQMSFPAAPAQYVKNFINAWLDGNKTRMQLLSSATLATQIQGLSPQPEPDYFTVTDTGGAAGHSYVEVKDTTVSFDITLQVVNQNLGHHYAIESCYAGC
jgi:hypothetical protein